MEAYGTTAFCDDIRTEFDGRNTLVGVYKYPLIVPHLPFTIPKLGFAISVVVPRDEPISKVRSLIYAPGDALGTPSYYSDADMSTSTQATLSRDALIDISDPDVLPPFHIWLNLVFSPVTIAQEGFFKVRFQYNSKTIRVGALRVEDGRRNLPLPKIEIPTFHQTGKPLVPQI